MKTELTKTSIKGLFLTNNCKAWRKDLKIEIEPTKNGKVRFNGKLYDLNKLIAWSGQKVPISKRNKGKPLIIKKFSISELQKQGFRKTKIYGLYINKTGVCYNSLSKRNLTITKGKVTVNGKQYNLAKIILETFENIPIRNGQVNFINGNEKDFSIENIQYKSTVKQLPPVATDLINCIRFYFEVDRNFNKSSFDFKYYLNEIANLRGFYWRYASCKELDLFIEWLNISLTAESKSIYALSLKHNFTATNGKNAVNKYLNLLVNECLKDSELGILQIKDFRQKPPTKTQKLKELQKSVREFGLNIKIPLRKPSENEIMSKYLKTK